MHKRARSPRRGLIGLLALPLCACALQTPTQRIHSLAERAEAAANRRDAPAIYALFCEDFSDQTGMLGEDTLHAMSTYFLLHRKVFALTRLVKIETWEQGEGRGELYVALAGEALSSPADLDRVPADILHLTVDLANDDSGNLCVRHLDWAPATARDLLFAERTAMNPARSAEPLAPPPPGATGL